MVITCVVDYVIDPAKIEAFERFGREWIRLVTAHGGDHHGYFLPGEGASDRPHVVGVGGQLCWFCCPG